MDDFLHNLLEQCYSKYQNLEISKFLSPRSIATSGCDQTSPKEFQSPISSISAAPGCSRERLLRRASHRLASETSPNKATPPATLYNVKNQPLNVAPTR